MQPMKSICGFCGADLKEGPNWEPTEEERQEHPGQVRREACTEYTEIKHPEWIAVGYKDRRLIPN